MLTLQKFHIAGPVLITPKAFHDDRGFFVERYNHQVFKANGLPTEFIQDNFSRSSPHVLRGLHFQWNKPQGKLVTCLSGEIFDVAVDLRQSSSTFGQHISVLLNGNTPQWLWIPAGFAHGFCVTGQVHADVLYKVDDYYNPQGESCLAWNDPDLKIQWPGPSSLLKLSGKDLQGGAFSEYKKSPFF